MMSGMSSLVLPHTNLQWIRDKYEGALQVYQQNQWQISNSQTSSDSESENGDLDIHFEPINVELAIRKIRTYTQCLRDIDQTLEHPALDDPDEDNTSIFGINQRPAEDYHTEILKAKFPKAEMDMIQCLGRTSWDRYQRMQREREVNSQHQHAARPDGNSEFVDSGFGTSLPASYASSMLSRISSVTGGKQVNIPPLSAEAKEGSPFDCVVCGKLVSYINNHEWRSVRALLIS